MGQSVKKMRVGVGRFPKHTKVSQGNRIRFNRSRLGPAVNRRSAASLIGIGDHYKMYGRWGKALLYYTRALRGLDQNMEKTPGDTSRCLVKIGEALFALGLNDRAELVTQRAVREVSELADEDLVVRMRGFSLLGDIYSAERRYLMAEWMYNTAIGYGCRRNHFRAAVIPSVFMKLGKVLAKQSRYSESIAVGNGGIDMLKEQGDGFEGDVAGALSQQGDLFASLGQPAISELLSKEANKHYLNASERREGGSVFGCRTRGRFKAAAASCILPDVYNGMLN